nr:DJ-1/PfpI family protein [Ningiella sp. W23]
MLATDGFEQSELLSPQAALLEAGADIEVVSIKEGQISAWNEDNWGEKVTVDKLAANANAADYDALLLPGGLFNPDSLRQDSDAKAFVDGFLGQRKTNPLPLYVMRRGYSLKLISSETKKSLHILVLKAI